jgi:para-nitrobenzyl esterase
VVVLFPGGGSVNGGNPSADSPRFIGDRDVVLVHVNFRMGMLGFLYLGELLGADYQASGSCGLMDQICALEWVRDNIAYFGGDPGNVTLMGQSAGAKSVCNLLISPRAKGLFRRAIAMSGAIQVIKDQRTAAIIAERFLAINGVSRADAPRLLDLPANQILAMQGRYFAAHDHSTGPTYDGVALPRTPEEYLDTGALRGVPVLIGYAKDERGALPEPPWTAEQRRAELTGHFGDNGEYLYGQYLDMRRRMPEYEAAARLLTTYCYGHAAVVFAEMLVHAGAQVWAYRWDHPCNSYASHGSDIRYAFFHGRECTPGDFPASFERLEQVINGSLLDFIERGDPSSEALPGWRPYTERQQGTRMYYSTYPSAEPFDLSSYDHNVPIQEYRLH